MYHNMEELLKLCEEKRAPLWEIILENEKKLSDCTEEEIWQKVETRYEVMEESTKRARKEPLTTAGNLISGVAFAQQFYSEKENTICGSLLNRVMAYALSCSEVNASMGKICALPTAGACGIVPAVLLCLAENKELEHKSVLQGLMTASGIGAIITKNATVSGAEGGCQAECGVAAAMAASAAVEMNGGSPRQALHACSIALMNVMGLVCDPIAGLVQVPCAQRNASQAVNALISADLALGGMESIIPPDQVVEAMYRVGKLLPYQLKETALGGLAATKRGKELFEEILK
ncbi:L-serine ammonia-lyase, iron-sulfur-dependent, subunit alpha [Anaerovorax sp. IOR16]|uniref:L-serine ammonia-lyase, iron-sulfur-dependent, subunit alpha n=1 Tax=Anaerovorax sp. IOR16 TaxID=2773458 RepID=UPI0019D0CBEF|nr:L-serine ammonia-lyase, iron-sulfur-dependent, subunit alpha [Anaerovorax sp. IOR16]